MKREPEKIPVEEKIYNQYSNLIDEAIENSLENIVRVGVEPETEILAKVAETPLRFTVNSSFLMLVRPFLLKISNHYLWQVRGLYAGKTTGKIKQETYWTRKERRNLLYVCKAVLFPIGINRPSYRIRQSVLIMNRLTNEEDLNMIAQIELSREESNG